MDKLNLINIKDVGIEILKTSRIKLNNAFIDKILSDKEKVEFNQKKNNASKKQYLATIWTCKEAIFKLNLLALNGYQKISILHDSNGKAYCFENQNIMLSVSHEKRYTIAIAFLNKEEHNKL